MLNKSETELKELGALVTSKEITQQPRLWKETYSIYKKRKDQISEFLINISKKHERIRVLFTGAGTSAYVGETTIPFVKEHMGNNKWEFESIPTTSIVSNPYQYLNEEIPTLLVSFARSGNSPESVKTVELSEEIVSDLYQMTITCSEDGKLAQAARGDDRNLLLLMPEDANDQGFAMTGAYTCMTLATLLIFGDLTQKDEEKYIQQAISLGQDALSRVKEINKIIEGDFDRIIYLGSGSLEGLAREAQLKVLELTAGQISTAFDSSLGFRHGPKSFVNESALAILFVSNHSYTRKYDLDMLNELKADDVAQNIVGIQVDGASKFEGDSFEFENSGIILPDAFLTLPYVVFAQVVSLLASIKAGIKPDDPSPSGTVNRVVKGVTIHKYY